jgi:hypothetical protein
VPEIKREEWRNAIHACTGGCTHGEGRGRACCAHHRDSLETEQHAENHCHNRDRWLQTRGKRDACQLQAKDIEQLIEVEAEAEGCNGAVVSPPRRVAVKTGCAAQQHEPCKVHFVSSRQQFTSLSGLVVGMRATKQQTGTLKCPKPVPKTCRRG